jgi:hypothetical protein
MTSLFHSLQHSLKVTPSENDQLEVTVTIPAEYFQQYIQLIDSFSGFVKTINKHARIQRLKDSEYHDKQAKEHQRKLDDYYCQIVTLYDQFTSEGFDRTQTIKRISSVLRASDHPWSSVDLVRPSLIEAGRPGQRGRKRST